MAEQNIMLVGCDDPEWNIVRELLAEMQSVAILGEAGDSAGALELAASQRPDVVIASPILDGESSLPTLWTIRRQFASEAIFILCSSDVDQLDVVGFGQLRLSGCFYWSELRSGGALLDREICRTALEAALTGALCVATWSIVGTYFYTFRGLPEPPANPVVLTDRQCRVLQMKAGGKTELEIADVLGASARTVQRELANERAEFGVDTNETMLVKATLLGIVH